MTEDRARANDTALPAINRRRFLAMAPYAGAAAALPAVALPDTAETPVAAIYREWLAHSTFISSAEAEGLPEEEFDRVCDERGLIENRICAVPSKTVEDVILKLHAITIGGESFGAADFEAADAVLREIAAMAEAMA
ncbi:hypothetical protein [Mangrovicoccus sp. HB161399]|uniref:hypothetical protein n=1 Tax=Mangrovicoccus sp. HB161399 TaxID=2720392 RepID=UPI001553D332|nr:hypothetical protein [Mangrovicoccus sp. HB161399]